MKVGDRVQVITNYGNRADLYKQYGTIIQVDTSSGRPPYMVAFKNDDVSRFFENELRLVVGRSFSGKKFDASKGEVVKECPAGWTLVKAIVNIKGVDKTIFKLVKGADTPSNREQWDEIRGAMLSFGFKWNRFNQTFDKFNTVDDVSLDALCATLLKYYEGGTLQQTSATTPSELPAPVVYEVVRYELRQDAPWFVYMRMYDVKKGIYDYYLWNDETKTFDIFWRELTAQEHLDEYIALTDGKYEAHFITKEQAENLVNRSDRGRYEILKGITSSQLYPYETFVSIRPFDRKKKENIKLEYCRIMWAEGLAEYADKFPKTFSSFTELTTYIRENIGELTTAGYDKHGIEWVWDNGDWSADRWDISEKGANPNKYSNLWAYESFGGRFYGCIMNENVQEWNDFYESRGLEGMELTKELYDKILDNWTSSDYWKKQSKMTQEQMKAKIEECFPKLYALFSQPHNNLSEIQKKIRGLEQILGNDDVQGEFAEELKKKIRGLKLLTQ